MSEQLAVLFDVDGVLVDSYQAHYESWQVLAGETGEFQVTEESFAENFGRTSREILSELLPPERLSEDSIAELDRRKEELYREIIRRDYPVMPGARELIEDLHAAGFRLAAGSSGPPKNVDLAIDQLELRPLFGALVHGREVPRGKPDPAIFLLCAERLDVAPENCAVIEDAAPGVAAAKAAGMLSIGLVSTGRTREELREADHVVERLQELSPGLIREWILAARERGDRR